MTFTNKKRMNSSTEATLRSCLLIKVSRKVSLSGYLVLSALLCTALENAEGALIQTPVDTTVVVNGFTILYCSSNNTLDELKWYHYKGEVPNDVYERGKISDGYKDRFDIQRNQTSGISNLLVLRPVLEDAGIYECREDLYAKGASAELTVLDSKLLCEASRVYHEAVWLMHCGQMHSQESLLSCSVDYRGNIAPRMTWNINETELLDSECGFGDRSAVCNATVEANLIRDGSVFNCRVITAGQYNCSLKVSKTIFTVRNITVMNATSCFANISEELQCEFKWTMDNNTVHMGPQLTPNKTGQYKCEVECIIRNKTCAMEVNALDADGEVGSEASSHSLWWIAVVIVIIVLAFVGVVLWKIICRSSEVKPIKRHTVELQPIQELACLGIHEDDNHEIDGLLRSIPSNEADEFDAIQAACDAARFREHGLSGHIHDGDYKGKQCTFERIMCADGTETTVLGNAQRWRQLQNDHLIKIRHLASKEPAVYVVTEVTAGRSLRKALDDCEFDVPILDWIIQIADGLRYLHQLDIVHNGIKSNQIFIMEEIEEPSGNVNKMIKIGCFNFFDDRSMRDGSSFAEWKSYMSPDNVTSEKSDVWSFSTVIWEIVTRNQPTESESLDIPRSCPKILKEILRDCRVKDPDKRPTSASIHQRLQDRDTS